MPGNIADRMAYWPRVQSLIDGIPVRRVWEIFNKMLIDREKFIFGEGYEWSGGGFLYRRGYGYGRLSSFIPTMCFYMDYYYAVYPPYPAQSGLPILDSYAKIAQYAASKYPDLHNNTTEYWTSDNYHPEQYYLTAAAGGDDEYACLNQNQLFEKLWNLLHYFGGAKMYERDRRGYVDYWGTPGHTYNYPGPGYSELTGTGFRFFYTPSDDLEYKYIGTGKASSMDEDNGLAPKEGWNILYESDWIRGPFISPLLKENSGKRVKLVNLNLNIYPRWPDFYDPETLEPVYFT